MESYERKTEEGYIKGKKYVATIKSLRDDGHMEIFDNGKKKEIPVVGLELMCIGVDFTNPRFVFPRLLTDEEKQILSEPGQIFSCIEEEYISGNPEIGETHKTVNTLEILNSKRMGWKIQAEFTRYFPPNQRY